MSPGGRHILPFIRFGIVGVANTAVDMGIFLILYYGLSFPLLGAHGLSFVVASGNSFLMNRRWTFGEKGKQDSGKQYVKFMLVAAGGLMISSVIIYVFSAFMSAWAAKLAAVGVTLVWNYAGSSVFVFGRKDRS